MLPKIPDIFPEKLKSYMKDVNKKISKREALVFRDIDEVYNEAEKSDMLEKLWKVRYFQNIARECEENFIITGVGESYEKIYSTAEKLGKLEELRNERFFTNKINEIIERSTKEMIDTVNKSPLIREDIRMHSLDLIKSLEEFAAKDALCALKEFVKIEEKFGNLERLYYEDRYFDKLTEYAYQRGKNIIENEIGKKYAYRVLINSKDYTTAFTFEIRKPMFQLSKQVSDKDSKGFIHSLEDLYKKISLETKKERQMKILWDTGYFLNIRGYLTYFSSQKLLPANETARGLATLFKVAVDLNNINEPDLRLIYQLDPDVCKHLALEDRNNIFNIIKGKIESGGAEDLEDFWKSRRDVLDELYGNFLREIMDAYFDEGENTGMDKKTKRGLSIFKPDIFSCISDNVTANWLYNNFVDDPEDELSYEKATEWMW